MIADLTINILPPGVLAAALLTLASAANAQSPATAVTPKFEVASIKPCKSEVAGRKGGDGANSAAETPSPGRLDLPCRTLADLVRMAYIQFAGGKRTLPGRRVPITGGPTWMNSTRYDIDAKAESAPGQAVMSGPMMQALLEDRFKLKVHHETRETSVYALTADKSGPKLQEAKPGNCVVVDRDHPAPRPSLGQPLPRCGMFSRSSGDGATDVYGTTMESLCRNFSTLLDRDVVDETGVAGLFDIHLELYPADIHTHGPVDPVAGISDTPATATDPVGGVLDLTALQHAVQKLGLKLTSTKGLAESLVIDHAERPSEN